MSFDLKKFTVAKFRAREEEIPVPELADFFVAGEKPVFRVRGLEGVELARVNEAVASAKNLAALAEALSGEKQKEKVAALREIIGATDASPSDYVKRLELVVLGAVEPRIDKPTAVKLSKAFPLVVTQLSNAVMKLTGEGMQPGKPGGSGKTPESGPPSASATSGDDSSTRPGPTSSPKGD